MSCRLAVIIPARDEEQKIGLVLKSLQRQTLKPEVVIVVDDNSKDRTSEIASRLGAVVIRNPFRHEESWAGKPELALVFNLGLREAYKHHPKYIAILGADTILEQDYFRKVIEVMERDPLLVIASGESVGEPSRVPRGSGRIYKTWWFKKYIGYFPICYMWESYPLYKALALGFKVAVIREAKMWLLRGTKSYKETYGYAMRELGYPFWYAFLRMFVACLRGKVRTGVKMFASYLSSAYRKGVDPDVTRYIKLFTAKRVLGLRT